MSDNSNPEIQAGLRTPPAPIKLFQHKRLQQIVREENVKSPPIIKIPASPMMQRLGYGTGIGVYMMERSPKASGEIRSPWAIKKLAKIRETKKVYSTRLEYEAAILKQLDHPNIVGFRGFANLHSDGTPFLALEKASTSLADIIEARHDFGVEFGEPEAFVNPLPSGLIIRVVIDIANALRYLHAEKRMIHGDLKSANILIFGDIEAEGEVVAKLCDFGVSRMLKDDDTVDGEYVGTEIWNPMEVILAKRGDVKYPITSKADIYPFGLTVYEMISLKTPHIETASDDDMDESCVLTGASTTAAAGSFTTDSGAGASFDDSYFEDKLAKTLGTRPRLPDFDYDQSYNKILEVFYCCTEENPNKRPTANEIYKNFCGGTKLNFDDEDEEMENNVEDLGSENGNGLNQS